MMETGAASSGLGGTCGLPCCARLPHVCMGPCVRPSEHRGDRHACAAVPFPPTLDPAGAPRPGLDRFDYAYTLEEPHIHQPVEGCEAPLYQDAVRAVAEAQRQMGPGPMEAWARAMQNEAVRRAMTGNPKPPPPVLGPWFGIPAPLPRPPAPEDEGGRGAGAPCLVVNAAVVAEVGVVDGGNGFLGASEACRQQHGPDMDEATTRAEGSHASVETPEPLVFWGGAEGVPRREAEASSSSDHPVRQATGAGADPAPRGAEQPHRPTENDILEESNRRWEQWEEAGVGGPESPRSWPSSTARVELEHGLRCCRCGDIGPTRECEDPVCHGWLHEYCAICCQNGCGRMVCDMCEVWHDHRGCPFANSNEDYLFLDDREDTRASEGPPPQEDEHRHDAPRSAGSDGQPVRQATDAGADQAPGGAGGVSVGGLESPRAQQGRRR